MRLEDERYESIKTEVTNLYRENDIKSTPISSFEVAIKLGIKIYPYSSLGKRGKKLALKRSNDGFSVFYNNCMDAIIVYNDEVKNYGRMNHTIMHEIGHYLLGHVKEGEEEEAEAKFFAKYALAPLPLIHTKCQEKTPECIMEVFDISYEAACNALSNYKKWMRYGEEDYTVYELELLENFGIA